MIKDTKQYHILVIEDNPGDFVIVEDLLSDSILRPTITHAINYKQAYEILAAKKDFDVILLDLSLPDKSRQQLVTDMLQISSGCCAIIVLTGYTDIDFSIKSVSQGISDYLLKDELNAGMLYKSIIYAIERRKAVSALERSQKQYSDLFNLSPQPKWIFELDTFKFIQVNKATTALYGYTEEELLNMTLLDIKLEEDIAAAKAGVIDAENVGKFYTTTTRHVKKSGEVMEVEIYTTPIIINNKSCRSVIAIDVTEKNQSANKFTRAIIKAQEDERYEIGGELHDNVCQILGACQLNLSMLKGSLPEDGLPFFNRCKENIGLALNEIRNLSHRLAPVIYDDSTLEDSFMSLFNTYTIDSGIEIKLNFDDTINQYPLAIELRLNLYRILQEQLKNILKHAKATTVEVDVYVYQNKLKLKIVDNGIGFKMNGTKNGIGMANMKRRTELFSGVFSIDTSPGKGCTLLVDIPLQKQTELNNFLV